MSDVEFPVEPGDTVRWWTSTGFATGQFVRFNRRGRPVVVPTGKRSERTVDDLFPVNDQHMIRLRGRVTKPGYNDDAPQRRTRRR
jgi:hypothetical protein